MAPFGKYYVLWVNYSTKELLMQYLKIKNMTI
jgi:hypothetical protein